MYLYAYIIGRLYRYRNKLETGAPRCGTMSSD